MCKSNAGGQTKKRGRDRNAAGSAAKYLQCRWRGRWIYGQNIDKTMKIRLRFKASTYIPPLSFLSLTSCQHHKSSTLLYAVFPVACPCCVSIVMILLLLYVLGPPVILRSVLRDNETFSTHLKTNLSVPPTVVRSLMNAEIQLIPVSDVSLLHV